MMRTLYLNFQIVGEFMVIQPGYISGFFFATKKGVFSLIFVLSLPKKREFFNDKNKGFTSGTLKKNLRESFQSNIKKQTVLFMKLIYK